MTEFIHSLFVFIAVFILLFFVVFEVFSIIENEKKAIRRVIPFIFFFALILAVSGFASIPVYVEGIVVFIILLSVIVLILPFGNKKISFVYSNKRFDERDIMFSRMELKPGTYRFEEYYKMQPDNKVKDDRFREEPGLLNKKSKQFHPLIFSAADATFSAVNLLQPLVEQSPEKISNPDLNIHQISTFIKNWAKKLGAHSVGFTLVKEHHLYSHIGRGNEYGKPVTLNHKYAIAFTVEMDNNFVQPAPKGSIIMESSQQYFNAGQIAVQLAQFIRNTGYEARAHIDANYRVVCPTLAQDAGLGAIGRMGLLMTPKLGPRVRIGVVTTTLPLVPNKKDIDSSVIRFCKLCKKCASNCPSQAISFNSIRTPQIKQPWKINHEKCFTYWTKLGTDCGKCLAVCPYSHPNNFMHNIVRRMIKQNQLNRWLALKLDDYFYGKKPKSKPLASWIKN